MSAAIAVVPATVAHPAWCAPRACTTHPDGDEQLVTHRAVVLDEPIDGLPRDGRLVVDVVRGDIVCIHGGEPVTQDSAAVRVRGVDDYTELTLAQAGRLAAAVTRAAQIAGGVR